VASISATLARRPLEALDARHNFIPYPQRRHVSFETHRPQSFTHDSIALHTPTCWLIGILQSLNFDMRFSFRYAEVMAAARLDPNGFVAGLRNSDCHCQMVMVLGYGMKDVLVPIDKAGRIVLPKVVRHELAIKPGDVLRVAIRGLAVTLTPDKESTGFVRQGKALVFSTTGDNLLTAGAVEDLLEEERKQHDRRGAGGLGGIKPKT
jgi:AbrB family looped-hinge helix DNA binding protein